MRVNTRHKWVIGGIAAVAGLIFLGTVVHSPLFSPDTGSVGPVTVSPVSDDESSGTVVADDDVYNRPFSTSTSDSNLASSDTVQQATAPNPKQFQTFNRKRISTQTSDASVTINDQTYPLRAYKMLVSPNDPQASQWWTSSTGLTTAWDTTTGTSNTTIAIIDTGFGLEHEEFANRWYRNSGETGTAAVENPSRLNCTNRALVISANCNLVDDNLDGIVDNESGSASYQNPSKLNCTDRSLPLTKNCNNVDDDANGYVDDVTGWDFINNDSSVQAGQLNSTGSGTTHGTMVAGVAAATGNNAKGMAGVNWQAKILPIQALDDDGYGDTVSVGQAIRYATAQRVDVINISLGTSFEDPYVREAVEAATAVGIVVVAASGNDDCDCVSYPARYSEVVSVGATASSGARASFSSWGAEVDLVAPGTSIYTTTWSAANQQSAYASGVAGTSFASPYVAGLVGLLKAQQPGSTPLQLIAGLTESSSNSESMTTLPLDQKYGFGLASASNSVQRFASPLNVFQSYRFSPIQTGRFLVPSQPTEIAGMYSVYECANPATPVHQLTKGATTFFTISKVESRRAQAQGYAVSRFAYGCLQQNHDTHEIIRNIDLFREFRNIYSVK